VNVLLNTEETVNEVFASGQETFNNRVTSQKITEFQKNMAENFGIELTLPDIRYLANIKFSSNFQDNLISFLEKTFNQGIIASKNLFIHGEDEKGLTLVRGPENEKTISVLDILDIEESKDFLAQEIEEQSLSQNEKNVLLNLSQIFLSPNVAYDPTETQTRQEQAEESEETVFYTVKRGKVIIRKGDEVKVEALQQIHDINQNLEEKPSWFSGFTGTLLFMILLFLTLWYYLKSVLHTKETLKYYLMMGILLIVSLLFYKLSAFLAETFSESSSFFLFNNAETYRFAFPFQIGALIFAFLTTIPTALVYAVINSLLIGYFFKANFFLMIFSLIGSFAAIYGIKHYGKSKRTSPIQAGIFVIAPINVFVIITIHLIKERIGPWDLVSSEIFMGVLGGLLSASLALLFIPVFENRFGFITQIKLLELMNSDLPIFKRMAIEAPGSYHHSLVVSSLAEEAAKEINLDPMLVKTAALYHDIGKVKRPEYFIENRTRNSDRHKDLKPSMSTLVITNHVKEGAELAKKLKLPKKIREIIQQHHGNSVVRYFFEKAKVEYDSEMQTIGEESYRYPGPIPKSKEAALIMLADSVEAASRSLKKPTEANLKRMTSEIFEKNLKDGQLDDCDFSLKELQTIANSFLASLDSIYHPRVEYPGFDFEGKPKNNANKPKAPHDRNNQPPKKVLDK
jgi:putative nucleotidyltransferase with HDIG domain